MKYFIIAGLTIFLGTMLYLDIVKYFIDAKYHAGLKVVPVLLIALLFYGVVFNLSVWYKLTNKTHYGAYIAVLGAVITILLNILLIPIFGYMGSAFATFCSYLTMLIVSFFLGQKFYKIAYELKSFLFYFLLVIIIYITSIYIKTNNTILHFGANSVLLLIFVGAIIYKEQPHKLILKRKNQ